MSDLGWPLRRAASLFAATAVAFARHLRGSSPTASRALELEPGARVGVLAANTRAHAEAWLGVPAAGGVIVSLNYRLAPEELRVIAEDAQLSMLITDQDVDLGCERVEWDDLVSGPPRPPRDLPPDTLAAISYTGGTTGRPKGVMLSPRQPARQRAAQPGRHRPPRRPALAARVPDVPRRRDRQPARLHVGRARSRCCCRASTPPPCWRRSSASASPTPCSCRRCSGCCSTRRARTTPI